MARIFEDFERTDAAPATDTESSYHFLNRAARPDWGPVRDLIEEWFAEYPQSAQPDLQSRFRDDDYVQHMGAWWELYVYKLFRQLNYEVCIHPTLAASTKQPDFLVTQGDVSMYVECVVFMAPLKPLRGGSGGERSWIFEATNQAKNPNFMVDIEIRQAGNQRPKASEIIQPLEEWLSSLDPGEVSAQIAAGFSTREFVLTTRDWIIEYGAWPVDPERRVQEGRLLGLYPAMSGDTSGHMLRYRDTVKFKGGRYGRPDLPLVVAVLNTSGFLDEAQIGESLFGTKAFEYKPERDAFVTVRTRDGYWRQGPPPRGTRVSAVLDGENIYPWRVPAHLPKLWINPWATHPLKATLPLATLTAHDTGEMYQAKPATSTEAIFGLSPDWPNCAS